jgi:hypothetical protein
MNKLIYEEQTKRLITAIDIAIKSFQYYPPKKWDDNTKQHIITTYLSWKNDIQNPSPKFKNKQSLKYLTDDVLIFSGRFWRSCRIFLATN